MSASVSGLLSDLDRVLLDPAIIDARVTELAHRITQDHRDQALTVVALMDGSLFFVSDLLRKIDLPIRLVTVSASSYHGATQSTGTICVTWPPDVHLEDETVLLLDDILDTGLTLAEIRSQIATHQPRQIRCGVLLSKRRPRMRNVVAEYVGFEIEDEFVVGYGMDFNGRFRNLPCIGVLKIQ